MKKPKLVITDKERELAKSVAPGLLTFPVGSIVRKLGESGEDYQVIEEVCVRGKASLPKSEYSVEYATNSGVWYQHNLFELVALPNKSSLDFLIWARDTEGAD
jgi:hypothetical protein